MSDWYTDRRNAEDQDKPLPQGWTRVETDFRRKDSPPDAPSTTPWGRTVYRHQKSATEKPTFWYYPFRTSEIKESTPFKVPEQTRFLFCKTWKASVLLRDRLDWKRADLWANDLDLRTGRSHIGRMWLHHPEQFDEEVDANDNGYRGTTAFIDVVAISRSTFSGAFDGQDEDGEPYPLKDRINVLWVKWEKCIAYRVASGFVNEEHWNQLDREKIDLVLG
jgi:hypothetical protein